MTHPEKNKNPTASPSITLEAQQRHSSIQNLHQQQSGQDPHGIQVHIFCLNQWLTAKHIPVVNCQSFITTLRDGGNCFLGLDLETPLQGLPASS